jgi:hypothetical protein
VFGKTTGKNGKRPDPLAHDGLVHRGFTAEAPNALGCPSATA